MDERYEALCVRRCEPRDSEAVWDLHNVALDDVGANLGEGSRDDDLRDVEGSYLKSGGESLFGELDGAIVAMGALRRSGPDRAEVRRMRVAPGFRGRGFGERMLLLLEERATETGHSLLHLDTSLSQTAALCLYEKHGYREVRRERAGPLERVFMEKEIGRRSE